LGIGHWSLVIGRWSSVAGHRLLVIGRWSSVTGRWSSGDYLLPFFFAALHSYFCFPYSPR
jgi:hypothetical protein